MVGGDLGDREQRAVQHGCRARSSPRETRAGRAKQERIEMIVLKKSLSRRTMLRGLGASVALPLLDSMVPAFSARAATAAAPINRFGVVYVPNGMIMENYLPKIEGPGYEITPTLSALEPFREHFQILSGLQC